MHFFQQIFRYFLFPLNGCRWFGGDIVADTVDVVNFIYDTNRNLVQNFVRDSCPVSGHKVRGGYTAQSKGVIIGSEVAHNADRTHVGQNCEVLMNRFIQSSFCNLITEDEISIAQNIQFFLGNFTDNTDCKDQDLGMADGLPDNPADRALCPVRELRL